jgi:CheY-like chemotaxis protein
VSRTGLDPARARFLSLVSHELRTPVNGVLGMAEALLATALTREQRDWLTTLRGSAEALRGLVEDIVLYAELDATTGELARESIDLSRTLRTVLGEVAPQAEARGLTIQVDIDARAPRHVLANEHSLRRTLAHLVGNAVKFTEYGGIAVEVACCSARADRIEIAVKDTGPGIDPQQLAALFEPFSQVDSGSSRRHGGAGLGLTLARALLARTGSRLVAQSAPGLGSRFAFEVDVAPGSANAPAAPKSWRGRRALLIGSRAAFAAQPTLEALGLACVQAGAPGAALEIARTEAARAASFDLVVVDASLPEPGPGALLHELRAASSCAGARTILAGAPSAEPTAALPAGCDEACPAPLLAWELADALARLAPRAVDPERLATRWDVLVVEDNPINQKVALLLLRKLGCHVDLASDGREGLELALERRYDLVLMDCQMPTMSGYEATREIRRRETLLGRHTPIVALTANALLGDRKLCRAAGMDDYLTKPVKPEELRAVLIRHADRNAAAATTPQETDDMTDPELHPVLDRDLVASLKEMGGADDPELFQELVDLFLRETPRLMADLDRAFAAGDLKAVERAAHSLKSSSANLGAVELSNLFREIEMAGRRADRAAVAPLALRAPEAFQRAEGALRAERG